MAALTPLPRGCRMHLVDVPQLYIWEFPCYCSNLQPLSPAPLCPAPRGAPAPPHVLRGSDTPRGSSPRLIRAENCSPDPITWGGDGLAASPTGGQGALRAPRSLPRVPVSPPQSTGAAFVPTPLQLQGQSAHEGLRRAVHCIFPHH